MWYCHISLVLSVPVGQFRQQPLLQLCSTRDAWGWSCPHVIMLPHIRLLVENEFAGPCSLSPARLPVWHWRLRCCQCRDEDLGMHMRMNTRRLMPTWPSATSSTSSSSSACKVATANRCARQWSKPSPGCDASCVLGACVVARVGCC